MGVGLKDVPRFGVVPCGDFLDRSGLVRSTNLRGPLCSLPRRGPYGQYIALAPKGQRRNICQRALLFSVCCPKGAVLLPLRGNERSGGANAPSFQPCAFRQICASRAPKGQTRCVVSAGPILGKAKRRAYCTFRCWKRAPPGPFGATDCPYIRSGSTNKRGPKEATIGFANGLALSPEGGKRCPYGAAPKGAVCASLTLWVTAKPRIGPADTTLYMPSGAPLGHEEQLAKPIDNAHIFILKALAVQRGQAPKGPRLKARQYIGSSRIRTNAD